MELLHQRLDIDEIDFVARIVRGRTRMKIRRSDPEKEQLLRINCFGPRINSIRINDDLVKMPDASSGRRDQPVAVSLGRSGVCAAAVEMKFEVRHGVRFVGGEHAFSPSSSSSSSSSSSWFPYAGELNACKWTIHFGADVGGLMRIASGEKIDPSTFELTTPTTPSNIGFAVGPFPRPHVDPRLPDVVHFGAERLAPVIGHVASELVVTHRYFRRSLRLPAPLRPLKIVWLPELAASDEDDDDVIASFASLALADVTLLHGAHVIDQTPVTRRRLAHALCRQWLGCELTSPGDVADWSDWWVVRGAALYLRHLWHRHAFGVSESRYRVWRGAGELREFERRRGGALRFADTHPGTSDVTTTRSARVKALGLMLAMERELGEEKLVAAIRSMLGRRRISPSDLAVVTRRDFFRSIDVVSGRDPTSIYDRFVTRTAPPPLLVSSAHYHRPNNSLTLRITSPGGGGGDRLLRLRVQEKCDAYDHVIRAGPGETSHVVTCHRSAAGSGRQRGGRSRRTRLGNGDLVTLRRGETPQSMPVLWCRWCHDDDDDAEIRHRQPDWMWRLQAEHERDPIAQIAAVDSLRSLSPASSQTFRTLLHLVDSDVIYYRVRVRACRAIVDLSGDDDDGEDARSELIALFRRRYFVADAAVVVVRRNDFSDLADYYVMRAMIGALARISRAETMVTRMYELNDNGVNRWSDDHHRAALISSLPLAALHRVVLALNMDSLAPSYRRVVTCACLRALSVAAERGAVDRGGLIGFLLRQSASRHRFVDVRVAAVQCLVGLLRSDDSDGSHLIALANIVSDRAEAPRVRYEIISRLAALHRVVLALNMDS
ncbi:MAG: hypothetical protein AAFP26_09635, partial [Planctomycetota bacterium]